MESEQLFGKTCSGLRVGSGVVYDIAQKKPMEVV